MKEGPLNLGGGERGVPTIMDKMWIEELEKQITN